MYIDILLSTLHASSVFNVRCRYLTAFYTFGCATSARCSFWERERRRTGLVLLFKPVTDRQAVITPAPAEEECNTIGLSYIVQVVIRDKGAAGADRS